MNSLNLQNPILDINLNNRELSSIVDSVLKYDDPYPIFELAIDGALIIYISIIKNELYLQLEVDNEDIKRKIGSRPNSVQVSISRNDLVNISDMLALETVDEEYNIYCNDSILIVTGTLTNIRVMANICDTDLSDYNKKRYQITENMLFSKMHVIYSLNAYKLYKIKKYLINEYCVFELYPSNSIRIYIDETCKQIQNAHVLPATMLHWGFSNINMIRWAIPTKFIRKIFHYKLSKQHLCIMSFGVYKSVHIRFKYNMITYTYILYNCPTEII